MTLKQLEAFYLAATLGSFALAAQRVHVTQSSLSKRIAELEAWVGAELFDRSGQRAQLTEAGQRIMGVAKQMLDLKDGLRDALDGAPTLEGPCRFGISELGALTWLPSFVERVRADHPMLVLQPHVDLGRRLERLVVRGELDFAIVAGATNDSRVASHAVSEVRFTWMAAPGRIRAGQTLDVSELSKHPVIVMTEGSGLTQAFDDWAAVHRVRMQRIVASNSMMAIIGLTIADMGLSFLPRDYMRPWIERGALMAFRSRPPLPTLKYCFIHRADDRRGLLPILLRCVNDVAQFSVPAGVSRKTT